MYLNPIPLTTTIRCVHLQWAETTQDFFVDAEANIGVTSLETIIIIPTHRRMILATMKLFWNEPSQHLYLHLIQDPGALIYQLMLTLLSIILIRKLVSEILKDAFSVSYRMHLSWA